MTTELITQEETKDIGTKYTMTKILCPFFGFKLYYEIDVESHSINTIMKNKPRNYCAFNEITTRSNACPCLMKKINWRNCLFNTKDSESKLTNYPLKIRVFPRESHPNGISLENWIEHVEHGENYEKHMRKE